MVLDCVRRSAQKIPSPIPSDVAVQSTCGLDDEV